MKLTTDQYDPIRKEWQAEHKVSKFLGNYSSKQFYSHWKAVTRPMKFHKKLQLGKHFSQK